MADPRSTNPQQRRANLSPLMHRLTTRATGEVVNFCPFGCADDQLDENGYCGHLVGFYNGGQTFEPRVPQKVSAGNGKLRTTGRIITDGTRRQPMQKGFLLVKGTTTARVYSPQPVKELVPQKNEYAGELVRTLERERQIVEFAERVRNPVLEGEWEPTSYDSPAVAAAAAPAE
jgi:hypothetical protein